MLYNINVSNIFLIASSGLIDCVYLVYMCNFSNCFTDSELAVRDKLVWLYLLWPLFMCYRRHFLFLTLSFKLLVSIWVAVGCKTYSSLSRICCFSYISTFYVMGKGLLGEIVNSIFPEHSLDPIRIISRRARGAPDDYYNCLRATLSYG